MSERGPRPSSYRETVRQWAEQDAERAERIRREELLNSRVEAENDRAELEMYGSRGRTYVNPETGETIADANNVIVGEIEAIRADRSFGRQAEDQRNAAAAAYENSILSDVNENGLPLAQAKLLADLELGDRAKRANLVKRHMENGSSAVEAEEKANALLDRQRIQRRQLIIDGGALNMDDYDTLKSGGDLYSLESSASSEVESVVGNTVDIDGIPGLVERENEDGSLLVDPGDFDPESGNGGQEAHEGGDGELSSEDQEKADTERLRAIHDRMLVFLNEMHREEMDEYDAARREFLEISARAQKGHLRRIRPDGATAKLLRSLGAKFGGNRVADFLTRPTEEEQQAGERYKQALTRVGELEGHFRAQELENDNMTLEEIHAQYLEGITDEFRENQLEIAEIQRESGKKPLNKWLRRAGYVGAGVAGGLLAMPLAGAAGVAAAIGIGGAGAAGIRMWANKRNAEVLWTENNTDRIEGEEGEFMADAVAFHRSDWFSTRASRETASLASIVDAQYDFNSDEIGKNRNRVLVPVLGGAAIGALTRLAPDIASTLFNTGTGKSGSGMADQDPFDNGYHGENYNPNSPGVPGGGGEVDPSANPNPGPDGGVPGGEVDPSANPNPGPDGGIPGGEVDPNPGPDGGVPGGEVDPSANPNPGPDGGNAPVPSGPEVAAGEYRYPWNWAAEQFGEADAMSRLQELAGKARESGYDVQWHQLGDGNPLNDWISINGDSNTSNVISVLNQFR